MMNAVGKSRFPGGVGGGRAVEYGPAAFFSPRPARPAAVPDTAPSAGRTAGRSVEGGVAGAGVPADMRWVWPFELLERVGRGGMGEVYKARFVKNDRVVAVKLLPDDVDDATVQARFEREMALLKGMRHPHIVLTFGGTTGNAPAGGIDTPGGGGGEGNDADRPKKAGKRFYAMEYLPGGTLQDELDAGGPLPPTRVVRLARQICDALAFAHGRGVIHRDLKPGNFLLDADGTLKLADFGLAAVREGSKLTAEGRTMGTFRYMAPEQIRGKPPACPQTDLYALGVCLFELLTGRPPYRGETPAETLQMHLKAPVPRVVAFEPHCPPDLDRLVADLMEKRIEDRPPDAAAVADRLAQIAGGAGGGPVVTAGTAAETAGGAIELRSAPKRSLPTAAPPRPKVRAEPVGDDADELVAAAPAKRVAAPAAWVTWTAAAALAGLAVAAVWLPSAAADAAALRRAETRWLTRLNAPGIDARESAAALLGELGEDGRGNLPALLAAAGPGESGDAEPSVRAAAAAALANFPASRGDVKPRLTRIMREDDDPAVRAAATASLRTLDAVPAGAPADPPGPPWWRWPLAAALLAGGAWIALRG